MEQNLTLYQRKGDAVEHRRELLRKPEAMAVLTPVEKAVFLASTDKPIIEYSGMELAAEMAKTLKWILKDIGCRIADEGEMQYLVVRTAEILKRYYPSLTLKDFRMAFEMSLTGELDDYLPRGRDGLADRNHYQQFNADYVCKILNAYKMRRAAVINKAREAVPAPEPERDFEKERFYHNAMCDSLINVAEFYKVNGILPDISPIAEMLYYQTLATMDMLKKSQLMTII